MNYQNTREYLEKRPPPFNNNDVQRAINNSLASVEREEEKALRMSVISAEKEELTDQEKALQMSVISAEYEGFLFYKICSADGHGTLCINRVEYEFMCGHSVCIDHTDLCRKCFSKKDKAIRIIQRNMRKYTRNRKLHNSATKIISFLKMVKESRKYKKKLHKNKNEIFLSKLAN